MILDSFPQTKPNSKLSARQDKIKQSYWANQNAVLKLSCALCDVPVPESISIKRLVWFLLLPGAIWPQYGSAGEAVISDPRYVISFYWRVLKPLSEQAQLSWALKWLYPWELQFSQVGADSEYWICPILLQPFPYGLLPGAAVILWALGWAVLIAFVVFPCVQSKPVHGGGRASAAGWCTGSLRTWGTWKGRRDYIATNTSSMVRQWS